MVGDVVLQQVTPTAWSPYWWSSRWYHRSPSFHPFSFLPSLFRAAPRSEISPLCSPRRFGTHSPRIISMSNDTKGMKPILPVLYTFPFLQHKKEPNRTRHDIQLRGLWLISQCSALCRRILAVRRHLAFLFFFSQSPWANFIYSAHWLLLLHNTENICFIMKPTEYLFWFLLLVVNRVQNTLYCLYSKRVQNYVNNQCSDRVAQILWLPYLLFQQKGFYFKFMSILKKLLSLGTVFSPFWGLPFMGSHLRMKFFSRYFWT